MPKIIFLITFYGQKMPFYTRQLIHLARGGPNYVTLQFKWGSKSLRTSYCYQVTQSTGKISYSKCNLMAKNAYFWPSPNICQDWLKFLHQDLKKSWFASNKLLMIFIVAILIEWHKVKHLHCQNNLFEYIFRPKNAILCRTT